MALLSNMTNINRISSDRHEKIQKRAGKLLSDRTTILTVKDGGESLMIWSHKGQNGVGTLDEVVIRL